MVQSKVDAVRRNLIKNVLNLKRGEFRDRKAALDDGAPEEKETTQRMASTGVPRHVTYIVIGTVAGTLLVFILVFLLVKYTRRQDGKTREYEKLAAAEKQGGTFYGDMQATKMSSIKEIPFTLPPTIPGPGHPLPSGRHGYASSLHSNVVREDSQSTGSGSEPSTPVAIDFPGAYSLGAINPELYKDHDEDDNFNNYPEGHIGRLWFALEYEHESEKLVITLIKAKNLPSRVHGSINGCDPYVRLYLMPDERRYLQSKQKRKTCNPKFDESFVFQISLRAFEERTLKLSVFDVDRHKKHNAIGHVFYQLRDLDLTTEGRAIIKRDLDKEVNEPLSSAELGEVNVALCYNYDLERLTATVFEVKDLNVDASSSIDTYAKITLNHLNKPIKTKKTGVVKKTENPVYNESFTFKLEQDKLNVASISVVIMRHEMAPKTDKLIGRVCLGSMMFARGKELEHWNEMLSSQKEQVQQWHSLTS